jgi:nitroimidazol reductase NimA-like FMN-containing flavoprotein (pyridoxamine 5'-phosphate oxidase superfamily)
MKLEYSFKRNFYSKLGTINKNGAPHVVPIWFTIDDEDDIRFNTTGKSIKAQKNRRDNRVQICR